MNKIYYIYMLRCKDGSIYTGYTDNIYKRIKKHRSGKGAKYTRGRGPFELVHYESFLTKEEAMQREAAIKKLNKEAKLKLIEENAKKE
ncbi:GIY-YIG nuclease family protein [Fenollaria massiliensis]|uniref:GIY-YIG nuclease family protein n=1 Tax=Fenollaria massiliensis TaxID=938288 RepID=UPI00035DE769